MRARGWTRWQVAHRGMEPGPYLYKSVPKQIVYPFITEQFLRLRAAGLLPALPLRLLFCRDLRGVLLPELVQLALKLVLKLSGAANIRTRREFDAALLQRVHSSAAYLFVHPNIGAKAATCALKLLFTFTF